jgi:hypothetical protein
VTDARDAVRKRALSLIAPPGATELARAAVGLDRLPLFVVLVVDDDGLFIAARDRNVPPSEIAESCGRLLTLSPPQGAGASVLVTAPIIPSRSAWNDVFAVFEGAGVELLDWLLDDGATTSSLARTIGEPTPW